MPRQTARTCLVLVLATMALLIVPATYLYVGRTESVHDEPVRVLNDYLRAAYARDYQRAYGFISSRDRRLKGERAYVRERGPFNGFTLEVAQRLAALIEARPVQVQLDGARARIKLGLKLPDANSLAPLVLEWDEERLNALSPEGRRKILATLEGLSRDKKVKMIEGEEEFELVQESGRWRIFLNWEAGVRITFDALVPSSGAIVAAPLVRETVIRTSELFTITYRVKNRSSQEVSARIVHRVEPKTLAQHLDLVECALLIPVRLLPGQEEDYWSTYLLRGDLPEGTRELSVAYEFKVEP